MNETSNLIDLTAMEQSGLFRNGHLTREGVLAKLAEGWELGRFERSSGESSIRMQPKLGCGGPCLKSASILFPLC